MAIQHQKYEQKRKATNNILSNGDVNWNRHGESAHLLPVCVALPISQELNPIAWFGTGDWPDSLPTNFSHILVRPFLFAIQYSHWEPWSREQHLATVDFDKKTLKKAKEKERNQMGHTRPNLGIFNQKSVESVSEKLFHIQSPGTQRFFRNRRGWNVFHPQPDGISTMTAHLLFYTGHGLTYFACSDSLTSSGRSSTLHIGSKWLLRYSTIVWLPLLREGAQHRFVPWWPCLEDKTAQI